jgi:hypothetical protein
MTLKNSQKLTAYQLIAKLNPRFRAGSSYLNMGESFIFKNRGYVRFAL